MCILSLSLVSALLVSPVTLPHEPSAQLPQDVNIISGKPLPGIDHVIDGLQPIALCLEAQERLVVIVTEKRCKASFTLFDEFGVKTEWNVPNKWGLHANDPRQWTLTQRAKSWNTNADSGVISNKRSRIHYNHYGYTFTLEKPDGEKRIYRCPEPASDKLKRAIGESRNKDTLVEVFQVSEVIYPNGNRLVYSWQADKLSEIQAFNDSGELIGGAELAYQSSTIVVTGSDGSHYEHQTGVDASFDRKGRVISRDDATYTYDYDRCQSTVQIGERVYTCHYEPSGKILSVEVDGLVERFHWKQRRLQAKTLTLDDALIYRREFDYDRRGELIAERLIGDLTGSGEEESYEVAISDQPDLVSEDDGDTRITSAYEGGQLTTRTTYDRGEFFCEERFEYDENGQLARIDYHDDALSRALDIKKSSIVTALSSEPQQIRTPSGWVEPEYSLTYDPLGNLISTIDPLGEETHYRYTCRGQIREIEYADGTREQMRYSKSGYLVEETSRTGQVTCYERDGLGRVLSTSRGDNYTYSGSLLAIDAQGATYRYDSEGRPIIVENNGVATHLDYDDAGRLISETTHAEGGTIASLRELDGEGRVVREWTESNGEIAADRSHVYNPDGGVIYTQSEDGSTEIEYDRRGRPIRLVDQAGGTTITTYDEVIFEEHLVHQTRTTNPAGTTYITRQDPEGRLIREEIVDLLGNVLTHRDLYYDPLGRLLREVHNDTYTNSWSYGPCGRLLSHTESGPTQQSTTSYGHDSLGRITAISRPGGALIPIEYDNRDQVIRYGEYSFTYDDEGRPIQIHCPVGTINRTYDAQGRPLEETFPSGLSVQYAYDALGRVASLTMPDGSTVSYEREGLHLKSVRRDHQQTSYEHHYLEYDQSGRPTLQELPLSGGRLSRTYDHRGCTSTEHTHFTEEVASRDPLGNPATIDGRPFSYDSLNRLTNDSCRSYAYDSLGNRLEHETDELNRLPASDLQGNLLSYDGQSYSYDNLGRLASIETDTTLTQYTYDPFDRCLSKTEFQRDSCSDWCPSDQQDYFYMGMMELGAATDGVITELRILGVGLGADIGALVAIELDGKPYVPISDRRGCIRVLLDGGDIFESYDYTPFGEENATGTRNPYRFMSKRTELGLVHFGHRVYHPTLGRFLTPDPARDGANLYAFCHNNPLSNIDLFGHETVAGNWGSLPQYRGPHEENLFVAFAKKAVGWLLSRVNIHISSDSKKKKAPSPKETEKKNPPPSTVRPAPVESRDGVVPPSLDWIRDYKKQRGPSWGLAGAEYSFRKDFRHIHVNGMFNSYEDVLQAATALAHKTKSPVYFVYNPTAGVIGDPASYVAAALGDRLRGSIVLERLLLHLMANPEMQIAITAHSQGGQVAHQSLGALDRSLTTRIDAYTFGSAKWIRGGIDCRFGRNYVSEGDWVAYLANACFLRTNWHFGRMFTTYSNADIRTYDLVICPASRSECWMDVAWDLLLQGLLSNHPFLGDSYWTEHGVDQVVSDIFRRFPEYEQ